MNPKEEDAVTRILKRVRRIELITRGLVRESLGGAYHSRFKGQGIEFDDFREYQAGDDTRFIDWNVTARLNQPFVRKYVEERELTVLLLVDVSSSGDFGSGEDSKRERAAELAAVFAFSALQNQDKVALALFSDQVEFYLPAQKGLSHVLRIIREILNYRPKSKQTAYLPALDLAINRISHRAMVFMISDFQPSTKDGGESSEHLERKMRATVAKHDFVAIAVQDPVEAKLPRLGRVIFEDPETGEQFLVNTESPKIRQAFEQQTLEQKESTLALFQRNQIEHLWIQTDEDYLPALKAYFRSRKRK